MNQVLACIHAHAPQLLATVLVGERRSTSLHHTMSKGKCSICISVHAELALVTKLQSAIKQQAECMHMLYSANNS